MNHFKLIAADESEALAEWLASDRWPFFLGHSPTQEEIRERIAGGEFFGCGCETFWILEGEEKIGIIELYQLDDLAPMFSIRLRSAWRGRKLGALALEWLTRYLFENFPDKRRIEAQTREDNIGMRKLLNRAGYRKEAYYRLASPTEGGGRVASVAYGILREDWERGESTPVSWREDSFFGEDL